MTVSLAALQRAATNATGGSIRSAFEYGHGGIAQVGGMATDAAGNIYTAGAFWGSVSFPTSPATIVTSTADADMYVAKFTASGQCVWVRTAHGSTSVKAGLSLDGALAVEVDAAANVYVGGGFVSRLAFLTRTGAIAEELSDDGTGINFEAFLAKYSADGDLRWATGGHSGAPQSQADLSDGINAVTDIVIDDRGTPFVAGRFAGTRFLGDIEDQEETSESVLARIDPADGHPVWITSAEGAANDGVLGLAIDPNGFLYTTGYLDGGQEVYFPTAQETVLHPERTNGYVAKYDRDGECLWARMVGRTDDDVISRDIVTDRNGNVYITGDFIGIAPRESLTIGGITVSGPDGLFTGFVAKLDGEGRAQWVRTFVPPRGLEEGAGATGERVAVAADGSVSVAGYMVSPSANFDGIVASSQSGEDSFVARYSSDGAVAEARTLTGSGSSGEDLIYSQEVPVATNPVRFVPDRHSGDLLLSTDYSGSIQLDSLRLEAPAAQRRVFVARISSSSAARRRSARN